MIYLIDNYDSFSYNLYQLIGEVDPAIEVLRNDALTVEELEEKNPEAVILPLALGALLMQAFAKKWR